jgi:hypothetical protein
MAPRAKKTEQDDVVVAPVGKIKKKKYYATYQNYMLCYPVVNEDGEPVYSLDNNGNARYDVDGRKVQVMRNLRFRTERSKMSEGYLSSFEFDPADERAQNQAIGKVLERLANDSGVFVFNQDDFDKMDNYDKWREKKRAEMAEGALEQKDATIAALEAKLAELSGKQE